MPARPEIENTLYRYAWTFGMDQLDEIGQCFTEDAEVEFSTGLEVGRDAVVAELRRRRGLHAPETMPWNVISNVYIHQESREEAVVTSWWTFFVHAPEQPPALTNIGCYDDVFVNDGGTWRIKHRRVLAADGRHRRPCPT